MANAREIQSRMKSIQDTMKITNAMYMISSTKLRKAKKSLEETEPYFNALRNMVSRVVRHLPDVENQYMDVRPNKAPEDRIKGFIVVTADKGLAGAYNHNVLKKAMEEIEQCKNYKLFVVGELGRQAIFRSQNNNRKISLFPYFLQNCFSCNSRQHQIQQHQCIAMLLHIQKQLCLSSGKRLLTGIACFG